MGAIYRIPTSPPLVASHLLISEPENVTPLTVLQMLKQRVSQKLLPRERESLDGGVRLRQFWQPRFYDFNVYRSGKVKEKLNYMHANPLIRGLVKRGEDWPWSSWSNYAKNGEGLIAVDPF